MDEANNAGSAKGLKLSEWAHLDREPTPSNRALQRRFLDEHMHYGGRIHEETAEALVAGLSGASGLSTGHGLYLRLFNEYATALEIVGAWGWTFRSRHKYKLFVDALLAYPQSGPHTFFEAVESGTAMEDLLRLPDREQVIAVMRDSFTEWSPEECGKALEECLAVMKVQAKTYLRDDKVILTTHNKGKHGATMYRDDTLSPREFYVLAPELQPADPQVNRYSPRKFTVDKTQIGRIKTAIDQTGATIRFLAGLGRALEQNDLLG